MMTTVKTEDELNQTTTCRNNLKSQYNNTRSRSSKEKPGKIIREKQLEKSNEYITRRMDSLLDIPTRKYKDKVITTKDL